MRVAPRRKTRFWWWTAPVDALAGLALFFLIAALLSAWSEYYRGSPAAVGTYWALAATIVVLLVTGFAVALSQRRLAAMIAYPLVGVVALAVIVVFAVPSIGGNGSEITIAPNPDACYRTDSENCPGG